MKIIQFSQIGKRSNNEDSLGTSAALLTVCDGMGGHNFGERASAFVKEAMLQAFAEPQPIGKMEIQQQLNQVQADLNQLLEKEPELEKMGTTFAGVFITPDVWYAAHIGDSRIYLFRPLEQKLWHTWDHSLVGELMRTKEITIEAGRFHPMSNRIAKAIIAQKDGKPASASIVKINELKPGDIFLLCSDGVVEGWGDWELVQLFSDTSLSFEQKCKKLAQQCNEKSKDNNTAIIAEVEETDAFSFGTNEELEWTTFAEVEADYQKYISDIEAPEPPKPSDTPVVSAAESQPKEPMPQPKPQPKPQPAAPTPASRKRWLILALLLLLAAVTLGTFLMLRSGGKQLNEGPNDHTESLLESNETDIPTGDNSLTLTETEPLNQGTTSETKKGTPSTSNNKKTIDKETVNEKPNEKVKEEDAIVIVEEKKQEDIVKAAPTTVASTPVTDEREEQLYNAFVKNPTQEKLDEFIKKFPNSTKLTGMNALLQEALRTKANGQKSGSENETQGKQGEGKPEKDQGKKQLENAKNQVGKKD